MTYWTLNAPAEAEIEIKKSRFLAHALPVDSRETALAHVAELKRRYPDARHHCWAYLLGDPDGSASAGMDDDGEPSGTAGRPILGVLQDCRVGDALIVVVRWFGGIKLGAGGLTRAYRQAAATVLDAATLREHQPMTTVSLQFDFSREAVLRQWASAHQGQWLTWDYTNEGIRAQIQLPESERASLQALAERLGIQIS